ncbi:MULTISPECIES: hypothetical protein [Candidatus Nitrosocaldus]|uniref:Nitrosopumilus output domain-containing protein n=1 Tax=Candidatus Nitrosocaldus cavascurensis TaxID=2058097 RepID=A0A2K5ASA1_9ARCH|nr:MULTISPECIES: hypothetical protein [Candidatus Nitrosocaldus]SPC34515.1 protein of unknown function [Candidatus Nitrosocaldus cavascurensis]
MQNQHATNHDEFVIRVSKLVREHLTRVLGNSTVMVIDSWLRQRGCRGIEDVCIDPEKVKLYLHMIFRDAAILLENEVARALEEEFLSYPEDNDHVKEVMLIVKKLRTHNR